MTDDKREPLDIEGSPDDASPSPAAQAAEVPATEATAESMVAPKPGEEPKEASTLAGRFLQNLWTANSVTVTVLAVVLALLIGAVLIAISDPNVRSTFSYLFAQPGDALTATWNKVSDAYANLFKGSIVDPAAVQGAINGSLPWERVFFPISETLTYAAPLAFTGLAFALAFRGGLFNIGVQGQATMGAIGAALAGFLLPLPVGLHLVVAGWPPPPLTRSGAASFPSRSAIRSRWRRSRRGIGRPDAQLLCATDKSRPPAVSIIHNTFACSGNKLPLV